MKRREFITLVAGSAATWPLAARAQQPERIRPVGVLTAFTNQDLVDRDDVATFTQEFQRLGWEEGRNFHLEYRGVASNLSQLRAAAADLVGLKPEVILVVGAEPLRATQINTDTIPIVFVGVTDAEQRGFVAELAHPGGNVTGFSISASSICSTWLQLLKEILPNLRHFAMIYNPETTAGTWLPVVKSVAPLFGLEVNEAAVFTDDGIDGSVLDALKTVSNAGVIVLPGFFTMVCIASGSSVLPTVIGSQRSIGVAASSKLVALCPILIVWIHWSVRALRMPTAFLGARRRVISLFKRRQNSSW
jgi:putative ABC transport system substrate-binding protein